MTDQGPSRSGGTVYGRGGLDVTAGAPSRLPRIIPAIVGAGAVAVLILGYTAWSSIGGGPDEPAAAATAPASVTTAAAPEPSTADPAPARLSTGEWLVSPLGDPNTYLTVSNEFAKMSPADPTRLSVVTGLADGSCFSFRLEDGRYLRHFDYRLRFDTSDDSDLFRADATFCPETGAAAGAFRLRSENYPEFLLHRRDDDSLYIAKPEGDDFTARSSFMVQDPSATT
ncbi:AbfB domain-containing protein [Actinoplanes utahensis]|uniref:Alpha-L-arabinofuranosidase B arabinose-binding domain-containing protein n=1 Tax=Actinoplanes utahensis TaxID=1869 RepID=A0A0A6XBI3_ACTUT|nr:AbfB domain-containing protein [Actinoplanes utahensis]KHD77457.1 hypothetical protein MB27_09990 [Actinoplanes utahensis]GIF32581.1 hypothetical protein Aut01nite_55670 [Actinoplanes utahensis]